MYKQLDKELEENQGHITLSGERLKALLEAKLAQGFGWGIIVGVFLMAVVFIIQTAIKS